MYRASAVSLRLAVVAAFREEKILIKIRVRSKRRIRVRVQIRVRVMDRVRVSAITVAGFGIRFG